MVADAGRRLAETADKGVIRQETFDQGAEVHVADLLEKLAQPFVEPADVVLGLRQEVAQRDLAFLDPFEAGEEDLQRALVELDLALDLEEVAFLESAKVVLVGVPHASADGPGLVAQL